MTRSLSIALGLVVARTSVTKRDTPEDWFAQDVSHWTAVGLIVGDTRLTPGSLLRRGEDFDYLFAGHINLQLHATEIESYRSNLDQASPFIYLVLKQRPNCPLVHLITAAPDEAEAYLEGGEDRVEAVPMPHGLRAIVTAFIHHHDQDGETQEISGRNVTTAGRPEKHQ